MPIDQRQDKLQSTFFEKNIGTIYPLLKLAMIIFLYLSLLLMQYFQTNPLINLLIAVILGFILCGGLNLAHECLHHNYLKSCLANQLIGKFLTSILLINFTVYKEHHLQHHKYVGTDKDTESQIQFKSLWHYFLFMTGVSLAFSKISKTLMVLWKKYPYYLSNSKKRHNAWLDSFFIYCFLFILLSLTFLIPTTMLVCYWLPLAFSYTWILFFGLPEHLDCDPVPGFYSKARSIRSNFLVRFFLWNGNFHAEHHLYPGIAGSNLRHVSKREKCSIYHQEESYLKWHMKLIKRLCWGSAMRPRVNEIQ